MQRILVRFSIYWVVFVICTKAENVPSNEIADHESEPGSLIKRSSHFHSAVFKSVKKFVWQPTWVKTWHVKKTYIPLWKRVWRPTEIRSWHPKPLVLVKPRARVIVKRIVHRSR